MEDVCSYCQRPYGTLSKHNNKPIFKTLDHIIPLYKLGKGRIRNKLGTLTRDFDNLIECCNECNQKKSNLTLEQFKEEMLIKSDKKYRSNIVRTINLLLTQPWQGTEIQITL